jgi:hypothetical protein
MFDFDVISGPSPTGTPACQRALMSPKEVPPPAQRADAADAGDEARSPLPPRAAAPTRV